ncbi:MAG: tetratricopeptide repeat protein [Bacteriovorax sp.]
MLFITFNTWAQVGFHSSGPSLEKYRELYKNAQYDDALEALKSVDDKNVSLKDRAYLSALTFSKLQRYDEAIANFKIAIKNNNESPDLYYEFGQALYANNNLRAARDAFMKSASKKFNYTASLYYAAFISELLEEYPLAKYNYARLIKDSRTDKKILQVSLFHYSKILLSMMREQEKTLIQLEINITKNIPKYIIPLLNKALEVDKNSDLASEINQLIQNLTQEFRLDPNVMENGRRISPSRHYGSLSLREKYDDNVSQSKKGSAYFEGEGYYKYDFVFNKKVISSPDIRLNFTKYKNQNESQVYLNDSTTITTDLKNRIEHKIANRPASFLIDLDLSRQYKDWRGVHHREYFYQNYGLSVGEQFTYFNSGETTVRVKKSNYKEINNSLNDSSTDGITLDQYFFLFQGQHLLITTLDTSFVNYLNNKMLNTNAYSFRLLYLMFEFVPSYTLQWGATAIYTDTLKQRNSRGNEITLNPSIELTKKISESLRMSINYNYTNNKSKSDSYAYEKQIVGTDLSYNF